MECEHKHIKSVNCELFCRDCGAKLPADFLTRTAQEEPKEEKPVKRGRAKK